MLKGLKVIDYATYVAGPGCAGILADWGADVIKVEPPGGDPIRLFFSSLGASDGPNPVFDMDNRGKRGVVLDTSKDMGREALLKLIDRADVFITNVRPGGLKRAGLDHDALLVRCPTLVYGSMTGYGLSGPDADRPGMDSAAFWARSGVAAMFRPKGGEPIALRTAFGDHVAAMAMASGVLAALYERTSTGKGRLVEASLLRAAHYSAASDFAIQHVRGRIASNRKRTDVPNPLINYWRTADGHWLTTLTRLGEKDWAKFARAVGAPHLIVDPRFTNAKARRDNGAALVALLDEAFAARTLAENAAALDAEQMIWSPMLTASEAISDAQAIAAGCVVQTPSPEDAAPFNAPGGPVRFPGADDGPKGPAPRIGEHTRTVLAELGYSPSQIEEMYASGAAQ